MPPRRLTLQTRPAVALRCPCGGLAYTVSEELLTEPANVIRRERRCPLCGERIETYEVVAGTEVTWDFLEA